MDNSDVIKDDLVYDFFIGAGVVEEVTPNLGFKVRFSPTSTMVYNFNGEYGGVKRLFWANPVLYIPRKGDTKRPLINALVQVVLNG
jgi:hypothetical protein